MAVYQEDWQMPGHWFDYFSFFEIPENATEQDIKNAYRKKAKQYHPDANPNDKVAEENFKKVNIVYEILSNPRKKEAYYNDYKLRKQNTSNTKNSQTKSASSTQSNKDYQTQSNSKDTESKNNKEEDIKFEDIVENYKRNPKNKESKDLLQLFLINIINSFKERAHLVEEIILEFIKNIYKNQMEKPMYEKTGKELKEIILKEIKIIQDFQKKYSIINEFEIAQDLNDIILEYRREIEFISENYIIVKMVVRKVYEKKLINYYLDKELFISKFYPKIQDANNKYRELESKMNKDDIDENIKDEFSSLLEEYQKILEEMMEIVDIRLKKNLNNSETEDLIDLYQNIITEKKDNIKSIINSFDFILNVNSALKTANILYQELRLYANKSIIFERVVNKELTEEKFNSLKHDFNSRYKSLTETIEEMSWNLNWWCLTVNNKIQNLKELKKAIEREISNNIITSWSWQNLSYHVQVIKKEEQQQKLSNEAEETAKKLSKELQPVIDFIINWNEKMTSYNALMSRTSNKVEKLLELCKNIEARMYKIPLFKEKCHNPNSSVYHLHTDCGQVIKILRSYKEFMKKMVSFENYIDFCSKNNERLEELLNSLQQEIKKLLTKNVSEDGYINLSKEIKEILKKESNLSSGIDKFSLNNNQIQERASLETEMRYFYYSRNRKFSWSFPELNIYSYLKFKRLQEVSRNLLKTYSLENIKKIKIENKYNDMKQKSREIITEINEILSDRRQGKEIDWQVIITNRHVLEEMLEEISQIIVNDEEKSNSNWQFYQELKMNIANVPTSEEKFIEHLKLRTLKYLKVYKENKKQIESSTITKETVEKYIQSYYDYQMEIIIIESLKKSKEKGRSALLESQIKVYQIITEEIKSLKSKCPNLGKLENKYNEEMQQKKEELFFIQNSNQDIDLNNLWRLKELEEELQEEPQNKDKILEFLEIIGQIAKEEYLKEHLENEEEISNVIRNIEAEKTSLSAKKNALLEYMKKNNLHTSFVEESLQQMEEELEDCESKLSILYL